MGEYKATPHHIKVCKICASRDVYCCATAVWDEEDQLWCLSDILGTEVCNTCGCESQIQTREIHVNSVGE